VQAARLISANPWRHLGRSSLAAGACSPARALRLPAIHDARPRRCKQCPRSGDRLPRSPRVRPGYATRPAAPGRTLARNGRLCAPIRGQTDGRREQSDRACGVARTVERRVFHAGIFRAQEAGTAWSFCFQAAPIGHRSGFGGRHSLRSRRARRAGLAVAPAAFRWRPSAARPSFSCQIFGLLRRQPVARLFCGADESITPMSARNEPRCLVALGRWMKRRIVSPFPLRDGRAIRATHATKAERRGMFGMPHAAPVRRLDTHLQNARRAIGPQSVRTL
jgi:hypothetical protein